jgi:hypothetical protein
MRSYTDHVNESMILKEAKMGRIVDHIAKYDCAMLTAFRGFKECDGADFYTLKENKARNKKLEANLLLKKYGVIKVNGVYIENYGTDSAKEVKEETFFVMNLLDKNDFKETIMKYAEEFEQDSILYIPKKEIEKDGTCDAFLISTNKCPNGFPGFGKIGVEKPYRKIAIGKFNEFMTKVDNKPFHLTEEIDNSKMNLFNGSYMSGLGIEYVAKTNWKNLVNDFDDE